jgi:hypothetical protein
MLSRPPKRGGYRDPNLLQCERCLRWIHAHCLPQPTPIYQLILIEGLTCHKFYPPATTNPCPHQICTIHFAPTPHIKLVIQKCPGGKPALHNFQTIPTTGTHTTHNSQIPISDPTNAKRPGNTPNRPITTTNTPYNLKQNIEQDTHNTSSPAPLSKHSRPNSHTTTPNQIQTTTEVFKAGRRRKPPRQTLVLLTTANNTQNTHTFTHPKNYATHKRALPLNHTLLAHEPSSPTKTHTQTTSFLTHPTQLSTHTHTLHPKNSNSGLTPPCPPKTPQTTNT